MPSTIKLKVSGGWVTLDGTAEWQFQREEATRIFGALLGVKGGSNEIELKPKAAATGIKAKIEDALNRDGQIDAASYHRGRKWQRRHAAGPGSFMG